MVSLEQAQATCKGESPEVIAPPSWLDMTSYPHRLTLMDVRTTVSLLIARANLPNGGHVEEEACQHLPKPSRSTLTQTQHVNTYPNPAGQHLPKPSMTTLTQTQHDYTYPNPADQHLPACPTLTQTQQENLPKVTQFHCSIFSDQNVLWFHVSVQYPMRVEVEKC